jgi:hypothetical protein
MFQPPNEVERGAGAGGLSPDEGVITPEMFRLVLRDKAELDAKWQRAMAVATWSLELLHFFDSATIR